MNKRTAKQKAANWARAYGSDERREWVQRQRCIVPGCHCRQSVNAHIEGDGVGRKAHHTKIIPVCDLHHREMHDGIASFALEYGFDLGQCAADTEFRWQAHCADKRWRALF